jgi:hypothetical protein
MITLLLLPLLPLWLFPLLPGLGAWPASTS